MKLARSTIAAALVAAAPALAQHDEQRKGSITATGVVVGTYTLRLDSGETHELARVKNASRGEIVVDLGVPNAHPAQAIREGDRIVVSGKAARIDGRPVVFARHIGQLHDVGAAGNASAPVRASQLIGAQVANGAGETLGSIEGLLLDTRRRGQHFAVLSRGDGKRFGYPVNAFRIREGRVVLHVPERNLEISPGYEDVRDAFQPDGTERYVRAREVLGKPVLDALGSPTGVMRDLMVSLDSARTRWALVDFRDGGVLPVPAHALRLAPDRPPTLDPDGQRRS